MDPELLKKAQEQHEQLMVYVEKLISQLYAVKDKRRHELIWYAVGALEIYKVQATMFFNMLLGQTFTDANMVKLCNEARDNLTQQLETIGAFVTPLLDPDESTETFEG